MATTTKTKKEQIKKMKRKIQKYNNKDNQNNIKIEVKK
jgi:hypothetical protein